MAEAALASVSDDCAADLARRGEAETDGRVVIRPVQSLDHHSATRQ
jgi:hypothetical protein